MSQGCDNFIITRHDNGSFYQNQRYVTKEHYTESITISCLIIMVETPNFTRVLSDLKYYYFTIL